MGICFIWGHIFEADVHPFCAIATRETGETIVKCVLVIDSHGSGGAHR